MGITMKDLFKFVPHVQKKVVIIEIILFCQHINPDLYVYLL